MLQLHKYAFLLSNLALEMLENFGFDPITSLRLVLCGGMIKPRVWLKKNNKIYIHKGTDVMETIDVIIEIRQVVSDVLNSWIQLLQLMLVHFHQTWKNKQNISSPYKAYRPSLHSQSQNQYMFLCDIAEHVGLG